MDLVRVWSIGEVAARTGLSVHALRLYEREGLLAGGVARDSGGRRAYTDWDVQWLLNCTRFRASGMPLATIRQLAELVRDGTGNEKDRLAILRAHRGSVVEQVARLADSLELIDAKVAAYEEHLSEGEVGDPWTRPEVAD